MGLRRSTGRDWRIRAQLFRPDSIQEENRTPVTPPEPGARGGARANGSTFLADYYSDVITNTGFTIDDWHVAFRADDVEGTVNAYWEEAQVIFPGHDAVIGEFGLREFFTELLPGVGRIHTGMLDFDASGRMAFLSGPYFYEVPSASGPPVRVDGTHLTVFVRKGRDWKIRSQIFRVEQPAPIPE